MSAAEFEPLPDDEYGRPRYLLDGKYVLRCLPEHPLVTNTRLTVLEHRLVLWDAGIDPTGYDVHHRNGDTRDNRLANLELVEPSDHHRLHGDLRRSTATRPQTSPPLA